MNESNLAVELKQKFKDKLVPIHMNLLSLDGFNDYGELEGICWQFLHWICIENVEAGFHI